MADIENVAVQPEKAVAEEKTVSAESQPTVSKGQKFLASVKEWFRKRIVNLKKNPQSIILVALFITTALWLIWLFTFSRTIYNNQAVKWCGLVVFINTLVSILIIALFGSAFPKRKKANIVFVILLFVFMAIIITCDVLYYVEMDKYIHSSLAEGGAGYAPNDFAKNPFMEQSLNLAIAHIVLVGICAILLATLPLYRKLINKINTRKVVESTEIKETIDVED